MQTNLEELMKQYLLTLENDSMKVFSVFLQKRDALTIYQNMVVGITKDMETALMNIKLNPEFIAYDIKKFHFVPLSKLLNDMFLIQELHSDRIIERKTVLDYKEPSSLEQSTYLLQFISDKYLTTNEEKLVITNVIKKISKEYANIQRDTSS